MAKDSLEKLGIPIIIHVFDTENNLDTVKKIITDERVKSSNILFGPSFLKTLIILEISLEMIVIRY